MIITDSGKVQMRSFAPLSDDESQASGDRSPQLFQ